MTKVFLLHSTVFCATIFQAIISKFVGGQTTTGCSTLLEVVFDLEESTMKTAESTEFLRYVGNTSGFS